MNPRAEVVYDELLRCVVRSKFLATHVKSEHNHAARRSVISSASVDQPLTLQARNITPDLKPQASKSGCDLRECRSECEVVRREIRRGSIFAS